jgi:hypothetical protein
MITASVESFAVNMPALRELTPRHYDELSLHKAQGYALAPQWNVYLELERKDELVFIALRRDAKLVGYWIGFVHPGLHYSTCLTSVMDIWFIHPDFVHGKAPLVLFNEVERTLTRRGVALSLLGEKLHRPCAGFYSRLGYAPVETFHAKWLAPQAPRMR